MEIIFVLYAKTHAKDCTNKKQLMANILSFYEMKVQIRNCCEGGTEIEKVSQCSNVPVKGLRRK